MSPADNINQEIPGGIAYQYFYRPLERIATGVEYALLTVSSLAILLAMVLTTIDVVLRYGFNSPLGWSFDLISLYLLPAAYYLAFAYAMKAGAHLSVDFFKHLLPKVVVLRLYPLLLAFASVFFVFVSWLLAQEALRSFLDNEVLFGPIAWLKWPTAAIIAVSLFTFSIRLLLSAYQKAFLEGGQSWK